MSIEWRTNGCIVRDQNGNPEYAFNTHNQMEVTLASICEIESRGGSMEQDEMVAEIVQSLTQYYRDIDQKIIDAGINPRACIIDLRQVNIDELPDYWIQKWPNASKIIISRRTVCSNSLDEKISWGSFNAF